MSHLADTLTSMPSSKPRPGCSLAEAHPDIAAQWHPTLNGDLTPADVARASNKVAWWLGSCEHAWDVRVAARTGKNPQGCPFCANKRVLAGYNDIATTDPHVAADWDHGRNELKPTEVTRGSWKVAWWRGPCGHSWETSVNNRCISGTGCHYCSGFRILQGFNDLATTHPELAAELHPEKNDGITGRTISRGYDQKVWWRGGCGHEWHATVLSRTLQRAGCPICCGLTALSGETDLATTHPDLAAEWHPARNGDVGPSTVRYGSKQNVWWLSPCGHEWEASPNTRTNNSMTCPVCSGHRILAGFNDLATTHATLAAEWHPSKNQTSATDWTFGAAEKVWWRGGCGHEWDAVISRRTGQGQGCPICSGRRILRGFNDLASLAPQIAADWHPSRNGDLRPDEVTTQSNRKVWWLGPCDHEWEQVVGSRTRDRQGCPVCKLWGTSARELRIAHEVAAVINDILPGGATVPAGRPWHCDMVSKARKVIIEYDGRRWHGSPESYERDSRKTRLLSAAGWLVFRVREAPLPAIQTHDILIDRRESEHEVALRILEGVAARTGPMPRLAWYRELGGPAAVEAAEADIASRKQSL